MIDLKKELQQNEKKDKSDGASSDNWLEEALDAAFQDDEYEPGGESAAKTSPREKVKTAEETIKRNWKWFALEAGAVLFVVLLIFNFVIGVYRISGDSMRPNFSDGDRVVLFRMARNIEKGDIIVFKTSQGDKLIKRVIAVEGDTVDISRQGGLYINGKAVEENYIYTTTDITDENVQYPVTVSDGCYFVLGDNRANSKDSRTQEIGQVDKKNIIGRVVLDIKSV